MTSSASNVPSRSVAIVGLAVRMPGAGNAEAFWRNLERGVDSTTRLTDAELLDAGVEPSVLARSDYVKAAAPLEGADRFDADYFGFTPARACGTDPQHRVLLECAKEALDDAGIAPSGEAVGVFVGCGTSGYLNRNLANNPEFMRCADPAQLVIGNEKDFLATSLSYALDLRGPSINVNTACSTSLVAVHLACQSLLMYECDIALAGGVSINVPLVSGYFWREGGIVSPDGRCRPFDSRASGTIFGSGAGIVVLARAADALEARHTVRALIRATAVNNDGAAKLGFAAPGLEGQAAVIAEALATADVDAASISYVEAHGTGTRLGDPVEVAALTRAFGAAVPHGSCGLGSVKGNVGHLNTAAGIASLVKTVLALEKGVLPPSLHCERPNPEVDFGSTPFEVVTSRRPWPQRSGPRRAGVSAFGVGGTNAHVVLEQAPAAAPTSRPRDAELLLLSARSPDALARMALELSERLARGDLELANVAYTLHVGRHALPYRRFVICRSHAQAVAALAAAPESSEQGHVSGGAVPATVWWFGGDVAQPWGVGRALYEREHAFRAAFDACSERLARRLDVSLARLLYGSDFARAARPLEPTRARAAGFAVAHALAAFWLSLGLKPDAVVGDGAGAWVAACVAGVFSLDDALELLVERGRLEHAGDASLVQRLSARLVRAAPRPARVPLLLTFAERPTSVSDADLWLSAWDCAQPVGRARVAEQLASLLPSRPRITLEVGPASTGLDAPRRDPGAGRWLSGLPLPARLDDDGSCAAVLEAVGALWAAGVPVDASKLYAGHERRRVSLPSYPFARRRYWVEPEGAGRPSEPAAPQAAAGPSCYAPAWREAPLTEPEPSSQGWWLVFADERVGPELARQLTASGQRALTVRQGKAWSLERDACAVDPVDPRHIRTLLDHLAAHGVRLAGVAYLWGLCPEWDDFAAAASGFSALLELARQLARVDPTRSIDLVVATRAAHAVASEDEVAPLQAMLLGACRTIPLEYPNLRCRNVDVLAPRDPRLQQAAAAQLATELAASPTEPLVAYRSGRRLCFALSRVELPTERPSSALRRGGVYVISGGLGGIGLLIAHELGRAADARLVLLGRSSLPARADWARWIADHDASDRTSQQLRALGAIEAAGGQVLALRADITREADVRSAIGAARAAFGRVDGLVHCAGVPDGAIIHRRTAAMDRAVLAPKVLGLLNLERSLADDPPDFIMLCSSLAAQVGDAGQVAYCAANSFLDAYASARRRRGATRVISVAWDRWQDVGMAAPTPDAPMTALPSGPQPLISGKVGDEYVSLLAAGTDWLLDEHRIDGLPLLPAMASLELLGEIVQQVGSARAFELRDVSFLRPMAAAEDGVCRLFTAVNSSADRRSQFTIAGQPSSARDSTRVFVRGSLALDEATPDVGELISLVDALRALAVHAPRTPQTALALGARWRVAVRRIVRDDEVVALLELPSELAADCDRYRFHPGLLDCAASLGTTFSSNPDALRVPVSIGRALLWGRLGRSVIARARPAVHGASDDETSTFDVTVADEHGAGLAILEGLRFRRLNSRWLSRAASPSRARASLAPEAAVGCVHALLDAGRAHVVVAAQPLDAALAPPDATTAPAPARQDDVVGALCRIWREVFRLAAVQPTDDFFALGGDSLIAVQLMTRIRESFGVAPSVSSIFEASTVHALAERIELALHAPRSNMARSVPDAAREIFEL